MASAATRPPRAPLPAPDPRALAPEFLDALTDAFFALDPEWRFAAVNRPAEVLLQRRREDLLGRTLWSAFPEAVGTDFETSYRGAVATGEVRAFEAFYPPLGMLFEVRAFPSAAGLAVVFRDVTREREDRRREREAAARLTSIVEHAREMICRHGLDGAYRWVSRGVTELAGWDPDDLIGRTPYEFMHPDDVADVRAAHRDVLDDTPVAVRYRFRDARGGWVWLAVSAILVRDEAGHPAEIHAVARDVSGEVVAQRALAQHAADQAAVARMATAVAEGRSPEDVYALVAREAARLFDVEVGAVGRLVPGGWEPLGIHGGGTGLRLGILQPEEDLPLAALLGSGRRSLRLDGDELPRNGSVGRATRAGFTSLVIAPLRMGGALWGTVGVGSRRRLDDDVPARLEEFARLATTTIAHAEARARLAAQATTDYLTGLLNHRSFHERLHAEWARARRHERPLSLVLFDIDRFKAVNDTSGHHTGDRVVAGVAERLRGLIRPGDVLGRIGGDEIAWLLPETDGPGAHAAAERARGHVAAAPIADRVVTLSAGVCDRLDAETLLQLADGALYWAKAHGRDAAYLYDPEVVRELSAGERAQRLAREQTLAGLRALARAVDAKDPSTQRHSERVAATAVALAAACGWTEERCRALHEAGLLHDVGKIGVPDAVLFKPGRLTAGEYAQVQQHAALGAEIANEVLAPEQVEWIRQHHERWDGAGYPAGIAGESATEGGRILALADAWDVMTGTRPYQTARSVEEALSECLRCAGTQFDPRLVAVLADCVRGGALPIGTAPPEDPRSAPAPGAAQVAAVWPDV